MSPHVSADSSLTAERVEKANIRLARGMMSGGKLYQTKCDLRARVSCVCDARV
jgi:hypothetical protein